MNTSDWSARIGRALTSVSPDDTHLYAGDDRLRLARRREAIAGRARKAAVLIPIVDAATPQIVLTERSRSLRSHPGQISFPGGSVESGDAGARAAAIREAHEEIGLDPDRIEILGRLPDYVTGTGFEITPFVARIPADAGLVPDNVEVVRVFTLPLAYAMKQSNFRCDMVSIIDVNYSFYIIEYEGNYIWGATAAMLHALRECVSRAETA